MDASDKKVSPLKVELTKLKGEYSEISKKLQADVRHPLSELKQLILEELDRLAT